MKLAVDHVSDTAHLVAYYRVLESKRANALFKDPFAEVLASPYAAEIEKRMGLQPIGAWILAMRTRAIDEHVMRLAHQGVDVIVNFACGLDSRPFRLDLPKSLKWVEVDFANVLQYKSEILVPYQPTCELTSIACDLADSAKRGELLKSLAGEGRSIAVLTEGLLPYLMPAVVDRWSKELFSFSCFDYWIMDVTPEAAFRFIRSKLAAGNAAGSVSLPFSPEEGPEYFHRFGWKTLAFDSFGRISKKNDRRIPFPLDSEDAKNFAELSGVALLTR